MKPLQIAIIGTGNVGATIAYSLLTQKICTDILLSDCNTQKCQGELMDLRDIQIPFHTARITRVSTSECAQADIIILCAGKAQDPHQSRKELLDVNSATYQEILSNLGSLRPTTKMVIITNPVDALTYQAIQSDILPKTHVIGSGTYLDTQRLKALLSDQYNINASSLNLSVVGEHGPHAFPLWSSATIGGLSLEKAYCISSDMQKASKEHVIQRAQKIIQCKGYTNWAIAACTTDICRALSANQDYLLPVSSYLAPYNICMSMPTMLSANGISRVLTPPMSQHERDQFEKTLLSLRQQQAQI